MGTGQRRGNRLFDCLIDQGQNLVIDGVQFGIADHAGLGHLGAEQLDAIVVLAVFLVFTGGAIGLCVAFEMAEEADHLAFHQRRTAALAGAPDNLASGFVDREEIEPVHGDARHAEPCGPVNIGIRRHRIIDRGRFRVSVVFHHENRWQVPDRGQVHGFQNRALVRRAVAEEGDTDAIMAQLLRSQCRPAYQGSAGAQNAVGAHHALGQIGNMHRPALARARAAGLAVDLGHHLFHADALGDAVAMAAMGRGDAVMVLQVHHDADARGLFPGIEVHEPGDVAATEIDMQTFFELADGLHPPISLEEPVFFQWEWIVAHVVLPCG